MNVTTRLLVSLGWLCVAVAASGARLAHSWAVIDGDYPHPDGYQLATLDMLEHPDMVTWVRVGSEWRVARRTATTYTTNIVTATPVPLPVMQSAGLFKKILTGYFGAGAETNRQVTAESVTAFFAAKMDVGTITSLEAAHMVALSGLFEQLRQPDGTTWSFPWTTGVWQTTNTEPVTVYGPAVLDP